MRSAEGGLSEWKRKYSNSIVFFEVWLCSLDVIPLSLLHSFYLVSLISFPFLRNKLINILTSLFNASNTLYNAVLFCDFIVDANGNSHS